LTGVAVNVTGLPAQTGLVEGAVDMLTGRIGFTVIVIGGELAGFPVGQMALEVIRQVITSPLTGVYV